MRSAEHLRRFEHFVREGGANLGEMCAQNNRVVFIAYMRRGFEGPSAHISDLAVKIDNEIGFLVRVVRENRANNFVSEVDLRKKGTGKNRSRPVINNVTILIFFIYRYIYSLRSIGPLVFDIIK